MRLKHQKHMNTYVYQLVYMVYVRATYLNQHRSSCWYHQLDAEAQASVDRSRSRATGAVRKTLVPTCMYPCLSSFSH